MRTAARVSNMPITSATARAFMGLVAVSHILRIAAELEAVLSRRILQPAHASTQVPPVIGRPHVSAVGPTACPGLLERLADTAHPLHTRTCSKTGLDRFIFRRRGYGVEQWRWRLATSSA